MKVLVVGSGGREHALCLAIAVSPSCTELFCAPGNAGIAEIATCVDIAADNVDALVDFCRENQIAFVVVGPEAPLVAGLVDALEAVGIKAFGPSAEAARLEGSKGYMKDVLRDAGVPTAAYGRFTDPAAAKAFIAQQGAPIVVKADGLAAGKGVILCDTVAQANAAVDEIMTDRAFGDAGAEVVVEEFLTGQEASFFALVDGEHILAFEAAQDHKAVGEGDTGPNTGGMGAYSPAPIVDAAMEARVMAEIIEPTVAEMAKKGAPYKGVLFAGLMIGETGPKVLEYNVRFGDPECQVLMARLSSDLLDLLVATADGALDLHTADFSDRHAMIVVMAAQGYPGSYVKGTEIRNLRAAEEQGGAGVLHAGTKREGERVLATGGRVLGIVATGDDLVTARDKAYATIDAIDWPEGFCRRDIGWRVLGAE